MKEASKRGNLILTSAFQLLMEKGPKGFTAGGIAAKAGVSKASLFHHFNSIDDLPLAVLEELIGKFSSKMAHQNAKTIEEYTLIIGKGLIEAPAQQRKITAAFIHFYTRSAHDESFRLQQEKIFRQLIETITEGFESVLGRSLTPRERETAPLLLISSLEGMGMLTLVSKNKKEFLKPWSLLAKSIGQFFDEGD